MKFYENTDIEIKTTEEELEKVRQSYFLNELSEQTKSEYINKEIIIHSPAKRKHIDANTSLTILLKLYIEKNKLGWLASEKALIKMRKGSNHYEPDVCFFNTDKSIHFKRNTTLFPPPTLAIEILSKSSKHRDRVLKFNDYARHDVEEYWIIEPDDYSLEQYYLESTGNYILAKKYSAGDSIKSITIKALTFPINAIFYYADLDNFIFGKYRSKIQRTVQELEQQNGIIVQKEQEIEQKKQEIEQKDQQIREEKVLFDKNKKLLAEKDQQLIDQIQLIKELQEKLNN